MEENYVNILQATDKQIEKFHNLIDMLLKQNGSKSLHDAVDMYNVLTSGSRLKSIPEPVVETATVAEGVKTDG
jgi:hypothetical protein